MIALWFACPPLQAQSRDLRPHTEYGTTEGDLRCKYEFYHDQWSERDIKHGRYSEWAAGDRLTTDGWYFDGLQDSTWKYWFVGGQLREVSNWEAGKRHGKTTLYDKNGRVTGETQFRDGYREGLQILYHPNGKVKSVAQFHNDAWHGNVTTYSSKGIRKRILQYEEGRRVTPDKDNQEKPQRKPTSDPPGEAPAKNLPSKTTTPSAAPKQEFKEIGTQQPAKPAQRIQASQDNKTPEKPGQVPAANPSNSTKAQPWETNKSQTPTKKTHRP